MTLRRLLFGVVALAAGLYGWTTVHGGDEPQAASAKAAPTANFARDVLPFLTQHCFTGHGKSRGEVSLDKYKDNAAVLADRKNWDTILHMIRTGEMPPKDKPRPPV